MDEVARLFRGYAEALGLDLSFQGFEAELTSLPGRYAPPEGALLLARAGDGAPLGCAALRPLGAGSCEMKRLYVLPSARGLGLGRALVEAVLAAARAAGHREIRLDTLPGMAEAIALYRRAGFRPIPPYYETPVPGTIFLARPLEP
nr:GNAT family N-acetyltransferase [Pararoseomonas indoligenes]